MKKLVVRGTSSIYSVDPENDFKIEQPPEKCYHCDKLQKINDACLMSECEFEIEEVIKKHICCGCGQCKDFNGVCVYDGSGEEFWKCLNGRVQNGVWPKILSN